MIVNSDSLDRSDLQNKTARTTDGEFASPDLAGNCSGKGVTAVFREVETESAAGIGRGRKKAEMVHYQVMRIREEDSLIGEDVADGSEKASGRNRHVALPVFFSRPILPCSPLGGKASGRQGIALN